MSADFDFTFEKRNVLDKEFCQKVIDKFELDPLKKPGTVLSGYAPNVKVSEDLGISFGLGQREVDWSEEIKIFDKVLENSFYDWNKNNKNYFHNKLNYNLIDFDNIVVRIPAEVGYKIQKYTGGEGFYDWHHDHISDQNGVRVLTFIIYLNDVQGPGGETQLFTGKKITAEQGKILIFPATWTYFHRGISPPKGSNKYIMTGWWYI